MPDSYQNRHSPRSFRQCPDDPEPTVSGNLSLKDHFRIESGSVLPYSAASCRNPVSMRSRNGWWAAVPSCFVTRPYAANRSDSIHHGPGVLTLCRAVPASRRADRDRGHDLSLATRRHPLAVQIDSARQWGGRAAGYLTSRNAISWDGDGEARIIWEIKAERRISGSRVCTAPDHGSGSQRRIIESRRRKPSLPPRRQTDQPQRRYLRQ